MTAAEVLPTNRACDLDLGLKDQRASYDSPMVSSISDGVALPASQFQLRRKTDGLCSVLNQGNEEPHTAANGGKNWA